MPVVNRSVSIIVLREVEPAPRNALWDLFSFEAAKVQQAIEERLRGLDDAGRALLKELLDAQATADQRH